MKFTHLVLMPIAYNDRRFIPDSVFDRLILELSVKFGGCTLLPPSMGGWTDSEGMFQPKKHRPLVVDVPGGKEDQFLEWVERTGRDLDQEVMLVMEGFCESRFVEIRSDNELYSQEGVQ